MTGRRLVLAVGLAASAGGLGLLVAGVTVGATLVSVVVVAVWLLALAWAGATLIDRFEAGTRSFSLPDVDDGPAYDHPGQRLADGLAAAEQTEGSRVERLRTAAVDVLVATDNFDPDGARDAVSSGAWTDDDLAAATLATDDSGPEPRPDDSAPWPRIDGAESKSRSEDGTPDSRQTRLSDRRTRHTLQDLASRTRRSADETRTDR